MFLETILESTGQFNIGQIEHARKKNQRAKSQKRGVPTAGNDWPRYKSLLHSVGTYVNPNNRLKRTIREQGRSWKAYKKSLKRARRNILNNK